MNLPGVKENGKRIGYLSYSSLGTSKLYFWLFLLVVIKIIGYFGIQKMFETSVGRVSVNLVLGGRTWVNQIPLIIISACSGSQPFFYFLHPLYSIPSQFLIVILPNSTGYYPSIAQLSTRYLTRLFTNLIHVA